MYSAKRPGDDLVGTMSTLFCLAVHVGSGFVRDDNVCHVNTRKETRVVETADEILWRKVWKTQVMFYLTGRTRMREEVVPRLRTGARSREKEKKYVSS